MCDKNTFDINLLLSVGEYIENWKLKVEGREMQLSSLHRHKARR
jgi:hypothetical protein